MQGGTVDIQNLAERYLRAALAGSRREALRLVIDEGVQRGVPIDVLRREVIQAAQHAIGELWEKNTIGVADEHVATTVSQLVLAHLYGHAEPVRPNGRSILVACVPGEQHEFPARLVADALDLAGFEVRFLGADVPAHALVQAAAAGRPDLVALSVTMRFNLPGLRDAVEALRASIGPDLPVVVGGHACESTQMVRELGVSAQASKAEELIAIARELTGLAAA